MRDEVRYSEARLRSFPISFLTTRYARRRLVKGEKLEDILATSTVEGVPTARVAIYYADQCGLDLPIFRCAAAVINGELTPTQARAALMNRPLGSE